MRKILARVDDDLHARIKRHAAEIGSSMNDVIVSGLERELDAVASPRQRLRARAAALGMLAQPGAQPAKDPDRQKAVLALRGDTGAAVLEGLEWARDPKP